MDPSDLPVLLRRRTVLAASVELRRTAGEIIAMTRETVARSHAIVLQAREGRTRRSSGASPSA
jgi:hypothetical protein